jgi:hypothetical protein
MGDSLPEASAKFDSLPGRELLQFTRYTHPEINIAAALAEAMASNLPSVVFLSMEVGAFVLFAIKMSPLKPDVETASWLCIITYRR